MNAIKKIILSISILLLTVNAVAQTNQYPATGTIQGNGFTYQADVMGGIVILYNRTNQLTGDLKWGLKDGSIIYDDFWAGDDIFTNNDDVIRNQMTTIVSNALSTAERQRVGRNELDLTLRINPETGVISEVEFRFDTDNPFATIPVSVYRTIEVNLKNQLRFTVTEKGRRLNYIFYSIDVRLQPQQQLPPPPPPPLQQQPRELREPF
jgi:hypothetical protein